MEVKSEELPEFRFGDRVQVCIVPVCTPLDRELHGLVGVIRGIKDGYDVVFPGGRVVHFGGNELIRIEA